jgi:hypothetical protein
VICGFCDKEIGDAPVCPKCGTATPIVLVDGEKVELWRYHQKHDDGRPHEDQLPRYRDGDMTDE